MVQFFVHIAPFVFTGTRKFIVTLFSQVCSLLSKGAMQYRFPVIAPNFPSPDKTAAGNEETSLILTLVFGHFRW